MDVVVFSFDPYLLAFVKGNMITLGTAVLLLKGIAVLTENTVDDKISTLFGNIMNSFKPKTK